VLQGEILPHKYPKTPFGSIVRKINIQAYQNTKKTVGVMAPFPKSKNARFHRSARHVTSLKPILPLIPEVLTSQDEDKSKFVTFEVKTKAGGNNRSTNTHKRSLRMFEEGSPQQWLELMEEVRRIWTQNSTTDGFDRAATLRAVLKGESLVAFEAALDDSRTDTETQEQADIDEEHVEEAISQVTKTIFPHRALELQQLWMERYMRKPEDMTTRKMASAITRINNYLPMFPDANPESKFPETKLIGLLEWSLPESWRAKFDLDGYRPSLHSKTRLIEECEAIERNMKEYGNEERNNRKQKSDNHNTKEKKVGGSKDGNNRFYCSECGQNNSHTTKRCRILRKRAQQQASPANKSYGSGQKDKPFSKRTFRKELNALTRKASRQKCLNLLVQTVERAKAKEAKRDKKAKKATKEDSSDSESASDESVQMIEKVAAKPKLQTTSIRASVVSKNQEPAAMETDKRSYNERLASLKARFDKAKAARKQRNTISMEEASFLASIAQGNDSESNESSEGLMEIDE
jgi:hypothetical protein